MRSVALLTVAIAVGLLPTSSHGDEQWAQRVRSGPLELRIGQVWTVALSSDIENVVRTLGDGVIPALIEAAASSDERLREGATWILCHLSDKAARTACVGYDTPPKPVFQPKPYYPADAFWQHVEGTVEVSFLINSNGEVAHAVITRSVRMLDQSALQCVRRWRFTPAQRGGRSVPAVAAAPVAFRITGQR